MPLDGPPRGNDRLSAEVLAAGSSGGPEDVEVDATGVFTGTEEAVVRSSRMAGWSRSPTGGRPVGTS
jgi:hypothetical protein